ncbi:MAG: hypothetical protein H6704_24055 [Myxococcales bacterium]|nr:hypothetical protein [Myxococcales bacterium]
MASAPDGEVVACDATELAARVARGELTCRAVVEAHLSRIEAVDPAVNAVTVVLAEQALLAADAADRSGGGGPLRGVPFTVKENLDCLGAPTTHGVRALRGALPYADAPAVERLKAAGALLIGRTNQSEMGLRLCTDNPLRGRTRNPWDAARTVGGSSGGDAAAVATGMAPLGLGNDMGGSLRVPAHCAGVAALKPTTGRVPYASTLPPFDYGFTGQVMRVDGPIARSVRDLRRVLGVLAGRDRRDPRSVDAPLVGPPPDERCAALVTRLPGEPLPPSAERAVVWAGERLAEAGWTVEHVPPPEPERTQQVWGGLLALDLAAQLPSLEPFVSPALLGHLRRLIAWGEQRGDSPYALHVERSRLARAWSGFFDAWPVVIGPTLAAPIWPVDADLDPVEGLPLLDRATRFVLPANLLGLPAVTLPVGLDDGLPQSVQVMADLWREDLCFEAAEVIERAAPRLTPVDPRGPAPRAG